MTPTTTTASLGLYHLLEPDVLACPYPLYRQLRETDPVHWDPYLHAWVVTRYADVVTVLQRFLGARTPSPEKLSALGLDHLVPIARVMVKQMLFLDPPTHGRIRRLAAAAFTPWRVELLRARIREIADTLIDRVVTTGTMEVMEDFANPLPAIVTAEMFGLAADDHPRLKRWSQDFAEMLGNFQHNPGRATSVLRSLEEMTGYFHEAVRRQEKGHGEGLIACLATAEINGDRLTKDEVVANLIVTMVGGLETTTNLIGNGLLTLLRHPEDLERLREDFSLIPTAIEELLRYESPSQHTARLVPEALELNGKHLMKGQAVIAVMGAANRDPERYPDPDHLDIARPDNRHLAFGWAAHRCFGAPLARIEGQVAFDAILRRLPGFRLRPGPITWRPNLGLRGLRELHVGFS
jgi:cytochrome P450